MTAAAATACGLPGLTPALTGPAAAELLLAGAVRVGTAALEVSAALLRLSAEVAALMSASTASHPKSGCLRFTAPPAAAASTCPDAPSAVLAVGG
jgi:hypothetical protein